MPKKSEELRMSQTLQSLPGQPLPLEPSDERGPTDCPTTSDGDSNTSSSAIGASSTQAPALPPPKADMYCESPQQALVCICRPFWAQLAASWKIFVSVSVSESSLKPSLHANLHVALEPWASQGNPLTQGGPRHEMEIMAFHLNLKAKFFMLDIEKWPLT